MSPYRANPFFAPTTSFFLPSVGDKVDQATAQAKAYAKEAEANVKSFASDAEAKGREFAGKAENKYYDVKEAGKDAVSVNPTGIDLYSRFALAGALGCAITHGALTPVDVVKTRIQLEPEVYNKGMIGGFRQVIAAEGAGALLTGLGPTVLGYSLQGALKFGGYEFWKKAAIDYLGVDKARENRQAIYLGASGIAEFFADIALCPLEATRIRLVSQPTFANGLLGGFARIAREEGLGGFYAGFGPILFKQVPYTMAKFAVFEVASEKILQITGAQKDKLTQGQSTGLNLSAGLVAGMAAAVISQPADTLLSKINKTKGLPGQSVSSRLVTMAGQLGVSGLFTGMSARLVMIGTLTAGQFLIYGDIKKALGAKGGAEIAAIPK